MTQSEMLLDRARQLVAPLKLQARDSRSLRRVLESTITELHDAELFKILQPKRWGGFEADLKTFYRVQSILAEGCPSTAWVFGVVSVHSWQLGLFELDAQNDVWAENRNALIASSYAPTGTARPVEGGYRVSGKWSFSSGCDNCDWIFLGAFAPEMRTMLLPASDYRIEDNWNTVGLEGTGSKDIIVEDAFVPAHRSHLLMDGFKVTSPGNEVNNGALYRIPFGQVFVRSVSTTAIGIAQGAFNVFIDVAKERIGATDKARVALDPTAQLACAEAKALIDDVKLRLDHNADVLMSHANAGTIPSIETRVQFRFDSANAVRKCVEAVDLLFAASGGRAIFRDNPIQPFFQDIHGANAHFANRTDKPLRNLGSILLGGETTDFFL